MPELDEIGQRVEHDALQDRLKSKLEAINQGIVDQYNIVLADNLSIDKTDK